MSSSKRFFSCANGALHLVGYVSVKSQKCGNADWNSGMIRRPNHAALEPSSDYSFTMSKFHVFSQISLLPSHPALVTPLTPMRVVSTFANPPREDSKAIVRRGAHCTALPIRCHAGSLLPPFCRLLALRCSIAGNHCHAVPLDHAFSFVTKAYGDFL